MVLNGRREGIAESTYERIWAFALENGYFPKGMKISELGRQQTVGNSIGYFLRAPLRLANKSNFFSHVTQGLHDRLADESIHPVFLGSEADFDDRMIARAQANLSNLRGIAIMGQVKPPFLRWVCSLGRPVVLISARAPGICHSVNSNEYQAAEDIVQHLLEMGHRRFAYFGGMCAKSRNEERSGAIEELLAAASIRIDDRFRINLPDAERNDGYHAAGEILKRGAGSPPTAWIFVNGLMARGAVTRLMQEQIGVGTDVSIAAFDQTRVVSEEHPTITSGSAVPEELGKVAAEQLLRDSEALSRHDKEAAQALVDIVVPSTMSVRESSGPVVMRKSGSPVVRKPSGSKGLDEPGWGDPAQAAALK